MSILKDSKEDHISPTALRTDGRTDKVNYRIALLLKMDPVLIPQYEVHYGIDNLINLMEINTNTLERNADTIWRQHSHFTPINIASKRREKWGIFHFVATPLKGRFVIF